jgi:hypothetical protein
MIRILTVQSIYVNYLHRLPYSPHISRRHGQLSRFGFERTAFERFYTMKTVNQCYFWLIYLHVGANEYDWSL